MMSFTCRDDIMLVFGALFLGGSFYLSQSLEFESQQD